MLIINKENKTSKMIKEEQMVQSKPMWKLMANKRDLNSQQTTNKKKNREEKDKIGSKKAKKKDNNKKAIGMITMNKDNK